MWCIYERLWSKFSPLFKLLDLSTQAVLCSGIMASLRNCEDFICKTCSTTSGFVDFFSTCITIDRDEFEIFSEFCFLGDVIGQTGGCTDCLQCDCSYWISLEGFSRTATNTHKQRYISCKPRKSI